MSGAGDSGPRRLDQADKKAYKETGNAQAASAKDKMQAVNEKAKQRTGAGSARPK